MDAGQAILPGSSWVSWLGGPWLGGPWLGGPALGMEQVAVIVSAVVAAITALCTVAVNMSLGLPACYRATNSDASSTTIKPRFRSLFQTGYRRYLRRVVAKNRHLMRCVRLERRRSGKYDKCLRVRRVNINDMQQALADSKQLACALYENINELVQENIDLTNKIAMINKRLQMRTEIQRLQTLQPVATAASVKSPKPSPPFLSPVAPIKNTTHTRSLPSVVSPETPANSPRSLQTVVSAAAPVKCTRPLQPAVAPAAPLKFPRPASPGSPLPKQRIVVRKLPKVIAAQRPHWH